MTKETLENKTSKCKFDKKNGCYALACYSHIECNSRDEHGNPMYVQLDTIKKEKGYCN